MFLCPTSRKDGKCRIIAIGKKHMPSGPKHERLFGALMLALPAQDRYGCNLVICTGTGIEHVFVCCTLHGKLGGWASTCSWTPLASTDFLN